jgi:hypothetical protein
LENNALSGPLPSALGNCTALRSLYLQGNTFNGEVPATFANLVLLYPGSLNIRWNALYTSDPVLEAFLDSKQTGGDWQSTQTLAPTDLASVHVGETAASLSWSPVSYAADPGGYLLYYSAVSGGPYTYHSAIPGKSTGAAVATGLHAATTYYFVLKAYTDPHAFNFNTVISGEGAEASATTTGTAVAPGEVASDSSFQWTSAGTLSWTSDPHTALYRLYRGDPADLPDLFTSTPNACLSWSGTSVESGPLAGEPSSGSFHWYVVVGVNAGLEGIAGYSSAGDPEVVVATDVCP